MSCTVLGWIQLVLAVTEVEVVGHGSRTARRMAVRALKYAVHVQDEAGLLDVVCHLDL